MAFGDAYMFPGSLKPVQTQLSFQSRRVLFSHALSELRGWNFGKNSQPPGHESYRLTTEPPGRGSKLKECEHNNFKSYENGRKLSKRIENTVGKGEIAC